MNLTNSNSTQEPSKSDSNDNISSSQRLKNGEVEKKLITFDTHTKSGKVKKIKFDTNKVIYIGEQWKTIAIINKSKLFLDKLNNFLQNVKIQKALLILSICVLIGNICVNIFGIMKASNDIKLISCLCFLIINGLFQFGCLCYHLYSFTILCCKGRLPTDQYFCMVIIEVFNLIIGIIVGIIIYYAMPFYAITIVILSLMDCFMYSITFILVILLSPLILISIIMETIIRLFICKLKCPTKEVIRRNFEYQLFKYDETMRQNECIVCLNEFKQNEEITILKCSNFHIFHEICITNWIKMSDYCPICRAEISFVLN